MIGTTEISSTPAMEAQDTILRLERLAAQSGLQLKGELAEKLQAYLRLLARWNTSINLTSRVDTDSSLTRLIIEPLIATRVIPDGGLKFLDVGSGGGSPAIPIKLVRPKLTLTMVESKTRKSAFLREAIRTLDLKDSTVETARLEDLLLRNDLLESMAFVSVRAVSVDQTLLDRLHGFLQDGGKLLLFESGGNSKNLGSVNPPLVFRETIKLVESLGSRLVVLQKEKGSN